MTLKSVTFCVKRILIGIQLIKEYKSIVNGFIKTISDKILYKLHLTKILDTLLSVGNKKVTHT